MAYGQICHAKIYVYVVFNIALFIFKYCIRKHSTLLILIKYIIMLQKSTKINPAKQEAGVEYFNSIVMNYAIFRMCF